MTLYQTLSGTRETHLAKHLLVAIAGSLLLTASAKFTVPFYPVPMTMQTLVVIGLGMALGPRMALATYALYLAQGALGLPVFAGTPEKGIGLAYMAGPTGGYLAGMALAAWLSGTLATRGWDRTIPGALLTALLSAGIIYVPGVLWLGMLLGWDKPLLEWGLYPFVLADAFKAIIAAFAFPAIWSLLSAKGGK